MEDDLVAIADMLHDRPVQLVSMAALQLDALVSRGTVDEAAMQRLGAIATSLREAATDLRKAIADLRKAAGST